MIRYKKIYLEYFGLYEIDTIWDEYEFIINDRLVIAENIHHIEHGANKHDDINNLMALSYENHTKAHAEILNRKELKDIHLQFLMTNLY